MTFSQLRRYLETECPVTIDPVEEDLFLVMNIVSFQEAYLMVEGRYTDPALVHFFYEVGVPAPLHLREDMNRYRAFRRELTRLQVPAMPDPKE